MWYFHDNYHVKQTQNFGGRSRGPDETETGHLYLHRWQNGGVLGPDASPLHYQTLVAQLHPVQSGDGLNFHKNKRKNEYASKEIKGQTEITWSVIVMSMYSAKAYPLLSPKAVSLTRLKARSCPNDMSSSFT